MLKDNAFYMLCLKNKKGMGKNSIQTVDNSQYYNNRK